MVVRRIRRGVFLDKSACRSCSLTFKVAARCSFELAYLRDDQSCIPQSPPGLLFDPVKLEPTSTALL